MLTMTAVSGILVALLLPAVQAAREAARRSQSMNNMKNIMLGAVELRISHERRFRHTPTTVPTANRC